MQNVLLQNKKVFLIFVDILSVIASFILAFLLRFDFTLPQFFLQNLAYFLPIFLTTQLIIFNFSGLYEIIWRFTSLWDMLNIIKAIIISFLI